MTQENIRRLLQPCINRGLDFENLGDKIKIGCCVFESMKEAEDYLIKIDRKDFIQERL